MLYCLCRDDPSFVWESSDGFELKINQFNLQVNLIHTWIIQGFINHNVREELEPKTYCLFSSQLLLQR